MLVKQKLKDLLTHKYILYNLYIYNYFLHMYSDSLTQGSGLIPVKKKNEYYTRRIRLEYHVKSGYF